MSLQACDEAVTVPIGIRIRPANHAQVIDAAETGGGTIRVVVGNKNTIFEHESMLLANRRIIEPYQGTLVV